MDKISTIIPSDSIIEFTKNFYDDVLHNPLSTIGQATNSLLKFVFLPISCLGMSAEQLEMKYKTFIARALSKVPTDKLITDHPSPTLIAPIMENVKYIFDDKDLYERFEDLLSSAFDEDKKNIIHPMFVFTLSQLSSHDAAVLKYLSIKPAHIGVTLLKSRKVHMDTGLGALIDNYFIPVETRDEYKSDYFSFEILKQLNIINISRRDIIVREDDVESDLSSYQHLFFSKFYNEVYNSLKHHIPCEYDMLLTFSKYGRNFISSCVRNA